MERVGLPPVAIQREHQESPEAFAQGKLHDQRLELADRPRVHPAREQAFDAVLLCLEPELVEPGRFGEQ